jgi:acetylornithine deacetylase/succinyl-diaminopimelate desuccinylase-like protein
MSTPLPPLDAATRTAIARAEAAFPATLDRLKDLVRIPSCSFAGFDHAHLERSAQGCVEWLLAEGYPEARVVRLPPDADGKPVLPYVIAKDHRAGPQQPTVLLYAHHDVQPPLREHLWATPPFEPTERDGRLYARGAADDKAGIAIHCAAAGAWNASAGHPPVNLTVVIEGEEEIGSAHFSQFLDAHLDELQADCLVIADAANFDTGLPSLTTSLRGNIVVEIELKALRAPLHSGMWGGPVPDAVQALCRLVTSLSDADGRIAIRGIHDRVRPLSEQEEELYRRLPFTPERFAEQAGMLHGLPLGDVVDVHRRLWRWPSLSVSSIQAGQRGQTGNVVMDSAWARIGLRIVPDMEPEACARALEDHLRDQVPAGMELTVRRQSVSAPWGSPTDHPLFATALAALEHGYGTKPVFIGCGGSIPFVGEMTGKLGGIPALLTGVEDPRCGAHAENESLHLADFRSALRAQVALFGLLARG